MQAALIAITSAGEAISSSIEGQEGADGPADEGRAQAVAQALLQLLVHMSHHSPSSGSQAGQGRLHILQLELLQSLAPALMQHLAASGGQAQVCCPVTRASRHSQGL